MPLGGRFEAAQNLLVEMDEYGVERRCEIVTLPSHLCSAHLVLLVHLSQQLMLFLWCDAVQLGDGECTSFIRAISPPPRRHEVTSRKCFYWYCYSTCVSCPDVLFMTVYPYKNILCIHARPLVNV